MARQQSLICKGCWQQMHVPIPLRGALSVPFRVVGLRPSRMNPNTCTFCELMFKRVMKATKITIDATILFADVRAYTSLSQSLSATAMGDLLDIFYDECAGAIWEYDGLLNKTIGDAVMAVFADDLDGLAASVAILHVFEEFRRVEPRDRTHIKLGVYGGPCYVVTANGVLDYFGQTVNIAARLQGEARGGELVVEEALAARAVEAGAIRDDFVVERYPAQLKGVDRALRVARIKVR